MDIFGVFSLSDATGLFLFSSDIPLPQTKKRSGGIFRSVLEKKGSNPPPHFIDGKERN